MKDKFVWIGKNILFGFLFGLGAFIAVTAADRIKRSNWTERSNCHVYNQESNELEILGYIPILDQKEFKFSYKIKNNTKQTYRKVRVELDAYKNGYLVDECSSTVQSLNAGEERNVVDGCYSLIPENVTEEYKFKIKVSTYQK